MGIAFRNPVDIANRALNHCGAETISTTLGFSEQSRNARICSQVYDQLRQSELERNVWRFAIKNTVLRALDVNTMLLAPSLWASTTIYFVGSIVADSTGTLWISVAPNNLNNQPASSPTWQEYFGPMAVMLYVSTTTYMNGELVYTTAGDGTYRVFMSRTGANADNPATPTAWDATSVYFKNQVVTYLSVAYMSRIDFNTNQTPSASAADWSNATTYNVNDLVTGSDGVTYKSIAGANLNHDPTISPVFWLSQGFLTPWTTVFVGGAGSLKWLEIGGAEFPFGVSIVPFSILSPLGSGPSTQEGVRSVFRLPAGFLREAPQDPKAGAVSYLGAPSGLAYTDWLYQGDFIVSSQVDPIVLRFIADVTDVTAMNAMFCEGLGARIGMEECETLTQSSQKVKVCADFYKLKMGEARTRNAILIGSEEPPIDNFIACRA